MALVHFQEIRGEDLEKVCIEAAEELGYKALSIDDHKIFYKTCYDRIQRKKEYTDTVIILKGLFPFRRIEISGIKKERNNNSFSIHRRGFLAESISEERLEEYLNAVSQKIWSLPS